MLGSPVIVQRSREPSGEALSATAVWLLAMIGFFLLGTELALVGSLRHKGKMIVDATGARNGNGLLRTSYRNVGDQREAISISSA